MDEKNEIRRQAVINELQTALAELESCEELTRFISGHGLQSRQFQFSWHEPSLHIDCHLPFARVFMDEQTQRQDEAEICAAVKVALLLLNAAAKGTLLREEEAGLSVTMREEGVLYRILGSEGETLDADSDLHVLISRLELTLPGEADQSILWL